MLELLTFPLIVLIVLALYVFSAIKIIPEYERAVVFRLGRMLPETKGPGLIFAFAPIDRIRRVSLRTVTLDVPPQDIITRDNVTVSVNAVVYFRVLDPRLAVVEVENYLYATSHLAQTTLRSVLGEAELDDLLAEREKLNARLQDILDKQTDRWGIKVSMVEIKAVDLPQEMRRAMSKQAEAEREKRAKIIHAEGEYQAAEKLVQAANAIATEPTALQLRYLQTLTEIGVEQNTTVVFPIPINLFEALASKKPDGIPVEMLQSLLRQPEKMRQ
jgi:regulator of protease activity HflC (stomatin/prohibitin superfamily)